MYDTNVTGSAGKTGEGRWRLHQLWTAVHFLLASLSLACMSTVLLFNFEHPPTQIHTGFQITSKKYVKVAMDPPGK